MTTSVVSNIVGSEAGLTTHIIRAVNFSNIVGSEAGLTMRIVRAVSFGTVLELNVNVTTRFLLGAGSGTWTVPSGITSITVEVWGAGASGGGGGAYSSSVLTVTPGAVLNYTVGAGAKFNTNGDGGDSWFNATSLANAVTNGPTVSVAAKGGQGLGWGALGIFNSCVGGDANSGVGAVKYSGGDGDETGQGFGGGSSATANGAGALNVIVNGGSAPGGGMGGVSSDGISNIEGGGGGGGAIPDGDGGNGGVPGGGGGNGNVGFSPGAGGAGQIRITY